MKDEAHNPNVIFIVFPHGNNSFSEKFRSFSSADLRYPVTDLIS